MEGFTKEMKGKSGAMADYRDIEKMLNYLHETVEDVDWVRSQFSADWIYSFIESQPTTDVAEVKRGEWKQTNITFNPYCSNCKNYNVIKTNYCPNCGADMRPPEAK